MTAHNRAFEKSFLVGKRVLVVGLLSPRVDAVHEMDQFALHLRQLGATVVGRLVQRRGVSRSNRPGGARAARLQRPLQLSTFLGSGKVRELKELCEATHAELIVVMNRLTPTQRRTLEEITDLPVCDAVDTGHG
ncbi:MAG: hypothetical protein IPK82_34965 [Polyangiaceae bacterium]|nr:hypothetical protein [Polyangiaceae bacterium]